MAENKILKDFPKCPDCGETETLTRLAWKDTHGDKEVPFVSFYKEAVALTSVGPQTMISLPMVPGLAIHRDYCAGCGRLRVTRSETGNIPIGIANPGGSTGPQHRFKPKQ